MDKTAPKLPSNAKPMASFKNSPRKSSYTVGFPSNMPAALIEKNGRSLQDKSEALSQLSQLSMSSNNSVVLKEFRNGSRGDVIALEAWTHQQLSEIHNKHSDDPASAHREKEKESSDQIKVLDASAELLAKMIEVHCIDKARLLRKLWSSSADLFSSIYTELSSIIHELKLKLGEKNMHCARLEETMNRVRTAVTPGALMSSLSAQDRELIMSSGRGNNNNNTTAVPLSSAADNDTIHLLEAELLLKNQEMLQLQSTLTSLAVWFPNFAKFNTSILSKYLPPIDYLAELERAEKEREAEEKRLLQQKADEEARQALLLSPKSASTKHRATLQAIGEYRKDDPNHPKKANNVGALEQEMLDIDIAQNYLLKDLKRLQGLGVGFAVLDPTELEAAKNAITQSMAVQNSVGVFANPATNINTTNTSTATNNTTTSTSPTANTSTTNAALPKSVAAALGRTSIAVTTNYRSRLQQMKSFVEVQGDEYSLAPVDARPDSSGGDGGTGAGQDPSPPPLSMAAAAALALQNVATMDAPLVVSLGVGSATTSPKNTTSTANTSANTTNNNTTTINNTNTLLPVQTDEYEQKYRTLLIEAQKLEVAKATAERRMKEESKQHHKQLLRMSAHVTTLQNKLQASNNSANLMLQKIPHVVFTPMIHRDYNVYHSGSTNQMYGNMNSMCGVEYGSVVYEDSLYKPTKGTTSRSRSPNTNNTSHNNTSYNTTAPDVTSVSALNSLFDQSIGDISVLLNNSRVPSRGRSAHTANTNTTNISNTNDTNNNDSYASNEEYGGDSNGGNGGNSGRVGTSPPRSRGKSAPAQVPPPPPRPLTLSEVHTLITRFCTHFIQSAPIAASNNSIDGTHTSTSSARDELYVQFGQGPDQWKVGNLSAALNGQSVSVLQVGGSGGGSGGNGHNGAVGSGANVGSGVYGGNTGSAVYSSNMQYHTDSTNSIQKDNEARQPSVTFADEPSIVSISGFGGIVDTSANNSIVYDVHEPVHSVPMGYSVFAAHLLQYFASNRMKYAQYIPYTTPYAVPSPTSTANSLLQCIHTILVQQRDLLVTKSRAASRQAECSSSTNTANTTITRSPHDGFVRCMLELLNISSDVHTTHTIPPSIHSSAHSTHTMYAYLEHLNSGDVRQNKFRQSVFFDVFVSGFQAMQRYLHTDTTTSTSTNTTTQPYSFPISATERILRRMFTVLGEEYVNSTGNKGRRNTNNADLTHYTQTAASGTSDITSNTNNTNTNNTNTYTTSTNNTYTSNNSTKPTTPATSVTPSTSSTSGSGVHGEREAQSPPWWRTLTSSTFTALKHDVNMIAVSQHRARARAVMQMLGSSTSGKVGGSFGGGGGSGGVGGGGSGGVGGVGSGGSGVGNSRGAMSGASGEADAGAEPTELRVDCYECILACMNAVYAHHHRLMVALMNMYRYLQSLSIQHGVANRTYHLLLAHFLQSAYPSVQDVNNAFSISNVTQGSFAFAPRTAIVVNLELMHELQTLHACNTLCAQTFADAVLRSVPNYLVQGLCMLLDPQMSGVAAHRAKLVADGSLQLSALRQMLQRAHQHVQNEATGSTSSISGCASGVAGVVSSVKAASPSKRRTVINSNTIVAGSNVDSTGGSSGVKRGPSSPQGIDTGASVQPSHFKQNYLLNKLLYPEETNINTTQYTTNANTSTGVSEEEFLLHELLDYTTLLGIDADLPTSTVAINPFIQKLLLHTKLSYDADISGVMAASMCEVTFTTWTLQYVVETLSRLRGSSMRLKTLFKRDMKNQYVPSGSAGADSVGIGTGVGGSVNRGSGVGGGSGAFGSSTSSSKLNSSAPMSPSLMSAKKSIVSTNLRAVSTTNTNTTIGSIGDYVLVDILLGDVDLDLFVRVETHYITALQRKVFRAWSAAVEDLFDD